MSDLEELRGLVDTADDCAAIQRDLDRLKKKWADRNLMKFSEGKCKVLPLRRNNSRDKPAGKQLCREKKLGVLVGQQCTPMAKTIDEFLGCFRHCI